MSFSHAFSVYIETASTLNYIHSGDFCDLFFVSKSSTLSFWTISCDATAPVAIQSGRSDKETDFNTPSCAI